MPTFPSLDWFERVREAANADAEFRSLGTMDAQVGVSAGGRAFALDFEAFECAAVREIEERELAETDFYIAMDIPAWRALLANIRENGGADSEHTLNALDIENGAIRAANPYGMNDFPRYHLTVQRFFDLSAGVETEFETGG